MARSRRAALVAALALAAGSGAAWADGPVPSQSSGRPSLAASARSVLAADPAARTITLVHGDASVDLPAAALGAEVDETAGTIASVRWDASRLLAQCDALGDALGLAPPFEGDVDIDDDAVAAVPPAAGEGVDCAALALRVERALAGGGAWLIDAPVAAREPHVTPASVDALADDIRALLEGPVAIEITFRGEPAGSVTLAPDDVRAALRVRVAGDPPRLEATLEGSALRTALDPVLAPLGEPARDADFEVRADGSVRVVPGRRGVRVDGAALFAAAAAGAKKPDKKATVAATKSDPVLSTKKAQDLQIKGVVASFTTKHPCCQPRVTNIHRIAALLDGAIVEPGDRFSVNRHVGKRTVKKGFVLAPSIGEGEVVDTIGGGVSQVTTTLYNAVFDAGYAVVSRKPHTFYFTRYPMGVEATLSWPRPDFVFRNDSKAGVLVRASFTEDSVTVKLYGDNGGRKVQRFVSKTFDQTDPRTDYEPDDTYALDKTKVKDAGTQGFSVKAGRDITFADGTKKHEERKVVYHGKPRVVIAHPCAIPKGEKGHRKKGCPKPADAVSGKDAAKPDDKKVDEKKTDEKKGGKAADTPVAKAPEKAARPAETSVAKASDKDAGTSAKAEGKAGDTVPAKATDKDVAGSTPSKAPPDKDTRDAYDGD